MIGDEAEQAVLELLLLLRLAAAPVRIGRPRVDLHRVGGDRHRVLAALAQALGERDRDGGLAHAGGPEDGDDL